MSQQYRVTFGQQYGREGEPPHPRFAGAHRDGWVTIVANSYEAARKLAFAVLGDAWADLYAAPDRPRDDWRATFPRGELLRIVAPGPQHAPSDEDPDTWAGWLEHAEDLTGSLARFLTWARGDCLRSTDQQTEAPEATVGRWLLADQHDELYGPDEVAPGPCPTSRGDGLCRCPDQRHIP